jgi:uncharacterized SAM-binding protein YcdF (DUF218 family)
MWHEYRHKKCDHFIIVLGHKNGITTFGDGDIAYNDQFKPSAIAQQRLDKAAEIWLQNDAKPLFILTGGATPLQNTSGPGITHSMYAMEYLTQMRLINGRIARIHKNQIVNFLEDELFASAHTMADAELALEAIKKCGTENAKITLVTSNFHMARALLTFKKVFPANYTLLPAPTDDKEILSEKQIKILTATENKKIGQYLGKSDTNSRTK